MSDAYKRAGVDIEAGYEAVNRMKQHVARTNRKGVMGSLGAFGGMFDLSGLGYKEPVLVSGTDGVGTKLLLAFMMDKHDTIGIDCVAMSVNDIVVQGAEPLYFLDYIATGKLVPERVEQIVKGIADGCEQAGCALIGGETAEMPDLYSENEYDLAGFAVGAAEKPKLITGSHIEAGDVLIGLESNGIHSNGYSLVRKILLKEKQCNLEKTYGDLSLPLGEELLRPTRIYVKTVLKLLEKTSIEGISHITGGGFIENIPRMLPDGLGAVIDCNRWEVPPIFTLLEKEGSLSKKEMFNTFNMGIGMVLAVSEEKVPLVMNELKEIGETAYTIGRVTNESGIAFKGGGFHD
ncbi:phosphoribosylformylglycinamidine cyclo-ligase [Pueribacillus theae]|uniref:Phosphoribosylformylglycinamidine cyclo-ligase n=1 Tax=Pueribacillus theae TaxID=2171751 RepID=A0A2U1JZX4_9BACI|nr:phosphoribosylformylglycinamidine cyclo-ligase [Pueribacillus theae]PWA10323.1 phosphoribosylformylglycinamidine cyclo-ligase [Pueribacillus theae]